MPHRVVHVVGARPNFMKVAPIVRELARYPEDFEQQLVHTGQHYDDAMSEQFFRDLDLPRPDINLDVGSGSHGRQTGEVLIRFEAVLEELRPDWVVVPGDVNSTVACALAATKLGIRVAHVEAGLRSFDRTMPEEINRILTDQIADLLLTPSADADENLAREGIAPGRIRFVGNVMIDTLVRLRPAAGERWPGLRDRLELEDFILVTLHRPSNVDDPSSLEELLAALEDLSGELPVVFPVHPRTRSRIAALRNGAPTTGVRLVDPVGYLEFLALQEHASLVLTDSGGVQEETTFLGVPCLTARPNTERPVTVTHGTNRLAPLRRRELTAAAVAALARRNGHRPDPPPLWDGRAAERIREALRDA